MKNKHGFTIVELLIVIVVIGILAAITIVAFNGVQTRAQNTQKFNEIKGWQKIFETYKAEAGRYPAMADGTYCLGRGFPVGGGGERRCRDFEGVGGTSVLESDNATLMNSLETVAKIPTPSNIPVSGTVGPYAQYSVSQINLMIWLKGSTGECPAGMIQSWVDAPSSRLACVIVLSRS